ncbi:MAG: hypothetical protein JSR31_18550 [Nitrospira sp.]|nr:hypothetical protein [Nitrospira sp.]
MGFLNDFIKESRFGWICDEALRIHEETISIGIGANPGRAAPDWLVDSADTRARRDAFDFTTFEGPEWSIDRIVHSEDMAD